MRSRLFPSGALLLVLVSCGSDEASDSLEPNVQSCAAEVIAFPATVSSAFPESSCISDGKEARFLEFTSTGGDIRFDVDAEGDAFTPEIAVLKEGSEDFVVFGGGGGSSFGAWSVPPGTYLLRVIAADGSAGPFTVRGRTTVSGCLPRALLSLSTATYDNRIEAPGNTSTGDCTFAGRNYDAYVVYSERPCTITMRGPLDAALTVSDYSTRDVIVSDDNSGGGASARDARITMAACRAGPGPIEIRATVSSVPPLTTGNYSLTVEITGGTAALRR
jgi:hypothetical protein